MSKNAVRLDNLTDEQLDYIRQHFADTRTEELAERLSMGYWRVLRIAHRLGLKKSKGFMTKASTVGGTKYNVVYPDRHTIYTKGSQQKADRDEWLRQNWPTTPDAVCAAHFAVNPRTIRRWACALGLKKDADLAYQRRAAKRTMPPEDRWAIIGYIAEHYPTEPTADIATRLGYSKRSVGTLASRYGIRKAVIHRRDTRSERRRELEAYLDEHGLDMTVAELARRFGFPFYQCVYPILHAKGIPVRKCVRKKKTVHAKN